MVNPKMVVGADLTKTYTATSGLSTSTNISNLPYRPGEVIVKSVDGGTKRYKFVLFMDIAAVAGYMATYTTRDDNFAVSTAAGDETSQVLQPAGMAVVAVDEGKWGWIQTYGLNDVAMLTDGSVVAGQAVIPHATTDGAIGPYLATETGNNMCGNALNTDSGSVSAIGDIFLDCPKG
ncbi:MAG: hypothetical protein NUW01_18205 [Gemmatimonadaceae bacterium]|nr:hypothetical protein [Gemmatimonadaceae bacterium]